MWRVSHLYFCVITVIVFSSATEYVLAESSSFVRLFAISESDKLTFVDTHNKYRRAVDPTAANMMQMSWDYLLEERAKEVARECDFRHSVDLGRNISTNDFLQVGENLYSGGSYFVPEMPTEIVRLWYEEYQFYDLDSITCQANKVCGHYTQAVWADSYKVGCAIAECSAIITGTPPYLVACLYGIGGNVVLTNQLPNGTILRYPQPPYITGTPCSQCAEGYVCNDKLCEFSTATATATPAETTASTDKVTFTTTKMMTNLSTDVPVSGYSVATSMSSNAETTTSTDKVTFETTEMTEPATDVPVSGDFVATIMSNNGTATCTPNACGEEDVVSSCTPTADGEIICICNEGFGQDDDSKCSGLHLNPNKTFILIVITFLYKVF